MNASNIYEHCGICGLKLAINGKVADIDMPDNIIYSCPRCGEYRITRAAIDELKTKHLGNSHIISGIAREANIYGYSLPTITTSELINLLESKYIPRNLSDKLDKMLLYILNKSSSFGDNILLNPSIDISITYSKGEAEFNAIRQELTRLHYLESSSEPNRYRLSATGMQKAEDVRKMITDLPKSSAIPSGEPAKKVQEMNEVDTTDDISSEYERLGMTMRILHTKVNIVIGAKALAAIIRDDIHAMFKCCKYGLWKQAVIMGGAVTEGILSFQLRRQRGKAEAAFKHKYTAKKPKSVMEFEFEEIISISKDLGIIDKGTESICHGIRDYRNYIHPYKQFKSGRSFCKHEAEMAINIALTIINIIYERKRSKSRTKDMRKSKAERRRNDNPRMELIISYLTSRDFRLRERGLDYVKVSKNTDEMLRLLSALDNIYKNNGNKWPTDAAGAAVEIIKRRPDYY